MKKISIAFSFLLALSLVACKGKEENKTPSADAAATDNSSGKSSPAAAITVTAMPDSAILGKKNELLIRIKNIKALQLSDPDGKNTGTELTYDIQATNRNAVGSSEITINPDNYRLELDNGTKISHESYNSFNVDAEATASSSDNKFKIDPGVKPVALDLFYDETRAVVKLNVQ